MTVNVKDIARKVLEDVYGKGDVKYLDQVCAPKYVSHDPLAGDADLLGVKAQVRVYRGIYAEGDNVYGSGQRVD